MKNLRENIQDINKLVSKGGVKVWAIPTDELNDEELEERVRYCAYSEDAGGEDYE